MADPHSVRPRYKATQRGVHLSGIYFLWSEEGTLLYVGQTTETEHRMSVHRARKAIKFDSFSVIELGVRPAEFDYVATRVESCYVRAFRPPHNSLKAVKAWPDMKDMDAALLALITSATASAKD